LAHLCLYKAHCFSIITESESGNKRNENDTIGLIQNQ